MELTLTVELSRDPALYGELNASLKRTAATLRKLQKRPKVDEVTLRKDLEELPQRLKEVKEDLEKRHRFCLDILSQVETDQERAEFLEELQGNQELVGAIKEGLTDTRQRVDETEESIEILYRVSSSRAVLERVQDELARKVMARALTRCSVDQEKVFQLRGGLEKTLNALKARGVHEALELEDLPAAGSSMTATGLRKDLRQEAFEAAPRPPPPPPPPRKEDAKAQPSAAGQAPAGEPDPGPAAPAEGSAAGNVTAESPATEGETPGAAVQTPPPGEETPAAAPAPAPPDPTRPAQEPASGAPAKARPQPASRTAWRWTRWACLAGLFLAGVPLGYFLAGLIRNTLG
jgi:hypothetical protein